MGYPEPQMYPANRTPQRGVSAIFTSTLTRKDMINARIPF